MPDDPRHSFITTELDPDLLSTPLGVQTNWHVITGAPCSGKTTLIDQLADRGFQMAPETGRLYFEQEMTKGRTVDEIRENGVALERGIEDLQRRLENGYAQSAVI